ncbi:MAG: EamA family transporter [Armatimonadetes bacterium]|nr:EamA family transporter [Armatimonadota bacterium]
MAWGTLGLASRRLFAAGLTPLEAATWRAAGACILLIAYCLLFARPALRVARRDLPLFAAYGAVSVAGFMTVYFTAIALTTVATAAVLLYTAPIWVVLLARLLFAEPVTRTKVASAALAVAGCALVISGARTGALRITGAGVLAGLGAGLTYALYSIFGKTALRRYSPLTTVVYALGFGVLFLLAALFLVAAPGGLQRPPDAAVPALVYVILVPTTAAYLLYIGGLQWVEAGRASVVATLEPVVASASGALILRESFGAVQWLGAALVLGGVLLIQADRLLGRDDTSPPGSS